MSINQPSFYDGLVLHRRPYRETSLIVDFFTRELGRVSAVCRGVRGAKSSKSNEKKSILQPFQPLRLSIKGRSELKTLTQIESNGRGFEFKGSVMFSALYLNEILNRVIPKEVAYTEIYDLYLASLLRLSEHETIETVLREFEINLLLNLGYGFDWQQDWQNQTSIAAGTYYCFVSERGFQQLHGFENQGNCFDGKDLNDIANFVWTSTSLKAAKRITRMALRPVIGDKPLKSRELFQKLE